MPRLTLLGGAVLEDEAGPISGPAARRHPLALLATLATAPSRTRSRSKVAGLLWPDTPEATARSRLNTCLYRVRSGLGSEAIVSAGDDLRLDPEAVRCDVIEFERALDDGRPAPAAELYDGPFLDGFRLKGAPAFEKWVDRERSRLAERYRDALETLAERAEERDDPAAAARWWRERAREQPHDSRVVRRLMEVLAAAGNRAEALQVAGTHERLLEVELGTQPGAGVRELAERLEAGALESGTPPAGRTVQDGGAEEGARAAPENAQAEPEAGGNEIRRDRGSPGRGEPRPSTSRRTRRRILATLVTALLVAEAFVWLLDSGRRAGADAPGNTTGGGESSVAVLPFQVSGEATETWADGMVTLLATGLDGATGVRAVSDRTVLAAWDRHTDGDGAVGTRGALKVAQAVGARYAVVGSAVAVGGELRLTAELLDARSPDPLGRAQVRGSPDSIAPLADELSARVLGLLAERTGSRLESADVASVTTRSLPALRAYLAGERHYRLGEFEAAADDYARAMRLDTTFALAHWRLASAMGWQRGGSGSAARQRAHELADQLPRRERRLLQASWLFWESGQVVPAVDSLRRLTDDYPDDPAVWYQLGEAIMHGGHPRGWPEGDTAFAKAVRLNPEHAPYYIHHLHLAIALHHDSSLATERAEGHPNPEALEPWFPLAMDLAFGDADRRRRALARLDTIGDPGDVPVGLLDPALFHPSDQAMNEAMLRAFAHDSIAATALFQNLLRRGRITEALRFLPRAPPNDVVACGLSDALSLGYPLPDSVLRQQLDPSRIGPDPSLGRLLCAGVYLAERQRTEAFDRLVERVRALASDEDRSRPERARAGDVVNVLRGHRAWRSGELRRAARLLSRSVHVPSHSWATWRALWRGDVFRELGELRAAEGWYQTALWHPLAHERLGRLYEEMGRPQDAAAAYQRFVTAWTGSDALLRYRVREARERLEVLAATSGPSTGS
jgi:DNA-binding SARP family transcriptional activator/TolB-like protein